jgi:hypothetical protein
MSKADGTKEITVEPKKLGVEKSIQEELHERREAIEADREKREKPRKDFMLGKGGKASDHFDVTTNREFQERMTNQDGAPESVDSLSESAREKWLRTGELPEKKPNGKATEKKAEPQAKQPERPKMADFRGEDGQVEFDKYEAALDRYEVDKSEFEKQAGQKNAEPQFTEEQLKDLDREIFDEIGKRRDWWAEEGHADAHKTLPDRTVTAIKALSQEEKNIIASSPVRTMQLHEELDRFLGHAMAGLKNLGRVHVELARDHGIVKRMNDDWVESAGNPKARWATEQSIRYVLKLIDKQAGKVGNGNSGGREIPKLTRAGRPPVESSGASSSPADDGSAEAAWKRKDLSAEARGELYRERKNKEESDARRSRRRR